MACERYVDALAGVAAGAPAGAEIEAHLVTCEACRVELQALRGALGVADAELLRLLAAEPSPALRMRIREAVAQDAVRRSFARWFPARRLLPAAATILTALAILVVWHETRPAPGPRGASPSRAPRPAGRPPTAGLPAPLTEARRPAAGAASRPAHIRAPHPVGPRASMPKAAAEPEVLVPPEEAEALARFALDLERRQVAPGSLLVADLRAPLAEPKPIDIAPIEIAPLESSDASGT